MMMRFRYTGLDPKIFQPLFALNDSELASRGIQRMAAEPASPCRVTLEDAPLGETLLLLPFEHQPANTPYRASGPIFVRQVQAAYDREDMPPAFRSRLLSVRAYDADGIMRDADVVDGAAAQALFVRLLAGPDIAYLHVHYAKRGCFGGRVERG
jgi:hypothetical protein